MSSDQCIVSQVHIPEYDPQGSLKSDEKRRVVDMSLRHLRRWNNNAYIILTGHGVRPLDSTLEVCDHVIWHDEILPLDNNGYVIGMPAQFKYVSYGIEHAKSLGFDHILKTRGDCIIGIPDICICCDAILNAEDSEILLTQQTGDMRVGDCFMYGNINLMSHIWHHSNVVYHADGLINTAYHFSTYYPKEDKDDWKAFVRRHASFRDVIALEFACLRWNYHTFVKIGLARTFARMLSFGQFPYLDYHWGRTNNWHVFNEHHEMIVNCNPAFWSAREFYD